MTTFLNWFFSFITTMFSGLWNGIVAFFKGIVCIFDFGTYFGMFAYYQSDFGVLGWALAILAFILIYAFWACIGLLIALGIRRLIRYRRTLHGNEDLLEEVARLQRELTRANDKKDRILGLKAGTFDEYSADMAEAALAMEHEAAAIQVNASAVGGKAPGEPVVETHSQRFYRLAAVDEKYASYREPPFDDSMNLAEICDDLRNFACSQARLYYEIKIIRLMIAGLASTKLILLQGISGTGKTSLPYVMGKYLQNDTTIASVQPSWRDRSELFGFFNEFTKKFNETEVLRRIYEASYTDDLNIVVLDEMNISRVEYYFAEMLSILEMPDPSEWKIQIVPSTWPDDPLHLVDGKLQIPQNVWYVGTANNDDSTFAVSDKVYDRALVINLDSKGVPFDAPETTAKRVSYSHLSHLYDEAINSNPVSDEILKKIEQLDNYVIEHFRVAFGNRIMKQLKIFVPVYVACGGTDLDAVDYLLATKVFRKFESLNLSLIRDEIKGLISCLDTLFGHDTMGECIAFLRRLQKTY